MSLLVLIILGAFVGWLASIVMKRDAEQSWFANIVVGIVGAFIGSFVSRIFVGSEEASVSEFDLSGLLWAFLGAVVLLAVINYLQRGKIR